MLYVTGERVTFPQDAEAREPLEPGRGHPGQTPAPPGDLRPVT